MSQWSILFPVEYTSNEGSYVMYGHICVPIKLFVLSIYQACLTKSQVLFRVSYALEAYSKVILGYHELGMYNFNNLFLGPNFSVVCFPPTCRGSFLCDIQFL